MSSWANRDPVGAANWLQGLPVGASRDAAVGSFVGVLSHSDPATAAVWAQSIGDDRQRAFQMENVARAWLDEDQRAASAWVQNSALPANVKQRLLGRPGG